VKSIHQYNAYSNLELADVHYMYRRTNGNYREVQRLYQSWIFPQRQCPAKNIFSFDSGKQDLSYPQLIEDEAEIRAAAIEEQVIRRVTENPRLSTKQIALEMQNISFSIVWRI